MDTVYMCLQCACHRCNILKVIHEKNNASNALRHRSKRKAWYFTLGLFTTKRKTINESTINKYIDLPGGMRKVVALQQNALTYSRSLTSLVHCIGVRIQVELYMIMENPSSKAAVQRVCTLNRGLLMSAAPVASE